MTNKKVHFIITCLILLGTTLFASGSGEEMKAEDFSIAVFVPGIVEGSPTYEMLVNGVKTAAEEYEDVYYKVIEGGFNQAEWKTQITSLAASGDWDLIVSSNPSIPAICDEVSEKFPDQKFLVLDGYLKENPSIYTVLFNHREQGFLIGYFGGLVTTSDMEHANTKLRVGMIVGQEYPVMNEMIRPGFELGLKTIRPAINLDFRVLGNWYDATKAAELANSMIESGVDVILTIAGSGNQGTIAAAKEKGAYVLWFDSSGYQYAPGTVVGSSEVRLEKAAYEKTKAAILGDLEYGNAEILGIKEGYIDFDFDHKDFTKHVPEHIQEEMKKVVARMSSEEIDLEVPLEQISAE